MRKSLKLDLLTYCIMDMARNCYLFLKKCKKYSFEAVSVSAEKIKIFGIISVYAETEETFRLYSGYSKII